VSGSDSASGASAPGDAGSGSSGGRGGGVSGSSAGSSPDGTRLYVTNLFTDRVYVINPATNAVVDTLGLPGLGAVGMAVSSDGTRVYAGLYFGASVMVLAGNVVV